MGSGKGRPTRAETNEVVLEKKMPCLKGGTTLRGKSSRGKAGFSKP